MPPLEATQEASASVLFFWRWMASRCLGIMTFVASARRVWRSIIYCAFAAALTAVLMLGLALHSARVVLHGDWLRGPNEVVGYICLLLRLIPMRFEACPCRCVFCVASVL